LSVPFGQVLGHDYAREGIWRSIAEGRLHHAILLHGHRGVGKRTLAVALARTLLCASPNLGPCETCHHCQRTSRSIHPDMTVLDREDVLGIDPEIQAEWEKDERKSGARMLKADPMRAAGAWLLQMPFEASRRVLVIVDAHDMNVVAANVFLKSLEEPAAGNVVILTSSAPAFLRPTIRSRCASIRLTGVPQGLIEKRLLESGVGPAEARIRAQASGGSLGRALQARPPLDELRDLILRRFGGGKDAELSAYAAATNAGSKDTDRDETLHLFATLLRDIEVFRSSGDPELLVHTEVRDAVARAAAGPVDAFALFSKVVAARERQAGQANRVLLWDDLLHAAASG
jgi:DNA polymerase-3 subunit delta'